MITQETRAWLDGIKAYEDGKPATDNPYMDDPKLFVEWQSGWTLSSVMINTRKLEHVG